MNGRVFVFVPRLFHKLGHHHPLLRPYGLPRFNIARMDVFSSRKPISSSAMSRARAKRGEGVDDAIVIEGEKPHLGRVLRLLIDITCSDSENEREEDLKVAVQKVKRSRVTPPRQLGELKRRSVAM